MTSLIKSIFWNNLELLSYSDKSILYLRLQNYYKAMKYCTYTVDSLLKNIEDILSAQAYFNEMEIMVDRITINQMLISIVETQENKDYILLADLLEVLLNPFILKLQRIILNKEDIFFDEEQYSKNIESFMQKDTHLGRQLQRLKPALDLLEEGYEIECTSCGQMTLALYDDNKKYYLHSNNDILHEAGLLAREWFSNDITEYIIYGLGLGYHISELMELGESITVRVYESDINVIRLACTFNNMEKILSNTDVHIIYDPDFIELRNAIKDLKADSRYVVHYPSLRNIKDIKIREQMEEYFVAYSTVNNQLHSMNNNFKRNINRSDENIDCLSSKFQGKDLFIVAAGPSLDINFRQLSKVGDNAIILATGTVLKKLLAAGIKPNYVIIIDATALVYEQVEGIDKTEEIPLLYLSSVYHKVPQNYKGKKYIICQEGYKKSEDYAKEKGYNLFHTGGSVSTTALDIGIQFNCRRIIFLGLDLAYSNNMDHAVDTAMWNTVVSTDLKQVEDIYGNFIETNNTFNIFRRWIEKRIENVKEIEFIDATEGGAKIKGMKIKRLSECL